MDIQDREKKALVSELRHSRKYTHYYKNHLKHLNRSEMAVYDLLSFHADNHGLCKVTGALICNLATGRYSGGLGTATDGPPVKA